MLAHTCLMGGVGGGDMLGEGMGGMCGEGPLKGAQVGQEAPLKSTLSFRSSMWLW